MSDNLNLMENLKCPVCLEFAYDPMECLHCSNIFCKKCVSDIKIQSCPLCREEKNLKESAFAKRLLSNVPITCQYNCGINLQRGEYKNHLLKCENRNFTCNFCSTELKKNEFISHILDKHEVELLNYFDKNYKEVIDPEKPINNLYSKSHSTIMNDIKTYSNNNLNSVNTNYFKSQSSPIDYVNNDCYNALLGENGVFYCGGKLNFICNCCDGQCGPTNGCVCSTCMRYNCKKRNLPFGQLINRKGQVATWKKGLIGGNFYCGAEFKRDAKTFFGCKKIIGNCNQTNAPCPECQTLKDNKDNYFSRKELVDLNNL